MITGMDFIFTGLQPWDIAIGSNAKDIALEISKHNRVLYVNTPLDKKTYRSKENTAETIQRKKNVIKEIPILRQINSNLWVLDYPFTIWPINFLPDGKIFDWINKINNTRMYSFVKKILNELCFDKYVLFIDNDIYRSFYAKDILTPLISIYYRRDNLLPVSFWKKHATRLEPLLIQKSDLIVCNSIELTKIPLLFNQHVHDVGQGVDLSAYRNDASNGSPEDIKGIKRPLVGYIGDITSLRLDVNLVYLLAFKNSNLSFVLVGKADAVFSNHKLNQLPNIHFLGLKPKQQVPYYIQSFDICLNPQLVNEVTIGNYPRKIDEFLAFGKPVIATSTQTMQLFKEYVYLCNSLDEYQQALLTALDENDESIISKRIRFAHSHSWKNSVNRIYQSIESIL